ncbi:uncharacterized protein LOC121648880 [Melanotaenia boesemani]|uniref:uncharacterized protein LOC121648880 n=1 Tax=Melanotaenia boesemani TaxID=1250792 RepID=UPI001C04F392|nr:uncharacterized protein LOC121648880 [Melanotaenia boesemani]
MKERELMPEPDISLQENKAEMEFTEIKEVTVGREHVPMRTVKIQQGTDTATVSLWREAATFPLQCGLLIRMSHLRHSTIYLQTTNFTKIEMVEEDKVTLTGKVEGVSSCQEDDNLNIDFSDGSELVIAKALWEPLEEQFEKVCNQTLEFLTPPKLNTLLSTRPRQLPPLPFCWLRQTTRERNSWWFIDCLAERLLAASCASAATQRELVPLGFLLCLVSWCPPPLFPSPSTSIIIGRSIFPVTLVHIYLIIGLYLVSHLSLLYLGQQGPPSILYPIYPCSI